MKKVKIAVVVILLASMFCMYGAEVHARQPVKPAAIAAPKIVSAVLDTAKALDTAQFKDLQAVVRMNELRTGVQLVVVIAPTLEGLTAEGYAEVVKKKINFALQGKPAVLFVVAVREKAAIITAGPGVEQLSAKAQNAIIQRIVLPNFRLGKLGTGVYDGARAITLALQVPAVTQATQLEQQTSGFISRWLPLIVLGVLLVGFGNSDWNRTGYYNDTGYSGRYGGGSRRY